MECLCWTGYDATDPFSPMQDCMKDRMDIRIDGSSRADNLFAVNPSSYPFYRWWAGAFYRPANLRPALL